MVRKRKGTGEVGRTEKYWNGNNEKESRRGWKNGEVSEW
jgi:hypothetical protein